MLTKNGLLTLFLLYILKGACVCVRVVTGMAAQEILDACDDIGAVTGGGGGGGGTGEPNLANPALG